MRCKITASFRATATLALLSPLRHIPRFEHRPFCNACQQNATRLVEIASQHWITAFRNPSRPVDFTGCIAATRQADISSDTSRPPQNYPFLATLLPLNQATNEWLGLGASPAG